MTRGKKGQQPHLLTGRHTLPEDLQALHFALQLLFRQLYGVVHLHLPLRSLRSVAFRNAVGTSISQAVQGVNEGRELCTPPSLNW